MRSRSGLRRHVFVARTALALSVALVPVATAAQDYDFRPRLQWDVRADGLFTSSAAAQLGAGANVPAGYYVRMGLSASAGPAWLKDGTVRSTRVDLTTRFLLDPFAEIRWGLYAGAGLSSRWDAAARWREYLLLIAGVEGPARGGWRTAIEAGLGGGVRIGVVLRRARRNGR